MCGMTGSDKDHGRSRRPSVDDRGWSHRSGTRWPSDRGVRWCRVRSVPCTRKWRARASWLSLKTKVDGLSLVWPQNHFDVSPCLTSKPVVEDFLVWVSKPAVMVWWFEPQNQAGYSLSVATQNRRDDEDGAWHPLRLWCPTLKQGWLVLTRIHTSCQHWSINA
jgi:hypothetical protein